MPEAFLNKVKTCYRQDGTGPPTFVLFNGAGCTSDTWGELAEWLTGLGRVVRFDTRGIGRTELPQNSYTLDNLAEDALALMNHLAIEKAILLGHAFGGRIAQIFARDYPERTNALILCGTGGFYPPIIGPPPENATRDDIWLDRFCGSGFREEQPERAQRLLDGIFSIQSPGMAAELRANALKATPVNTYWGTPPDSIPVLLIYGTEDRFGHTKNAYDLAARLKKSRLIFIHGAGHFAIREYPERVLIEIRDFVKEQGI